MLCVAGAETQLDDESTDHGREQDPAPPVRSLDPLLAAAAESNNAAEPPRPPPFPPLLVDGEAGADRTTTPAGVCFQPCSGCSPGEQVTERNSRTDVASGDASLGASWVNVA